MSGPFGGGLGGAWLVALREIRERGRGRTFLISTSLIVVLAFGAVAASTVLPDVFEEKPPTIAVVGSDVNETFSQLLEDGSLGSEATVVLVADRAAAEQMVRDGTADAAFSVGSTSSGSTPGGPTLTFRSEEDASIDALVTQAYRLATLPDVLASLDLTLEEAAPLVNPEPLGVSLLEAPAAGNEASESERVAGSAAVILLLMAMTLYGSWILNGVVEEKTSRVVEVLMGALRPWQLLLGKVGGILALALTQLLAGIGAVVLAISAFGTADLPDVGLRVGAFAVVYLLLGLLLYSFAFAAAGATASRQEDAQTVVMPVNFTLIGVYLISLTVVVNQPDGLFARVLSMFPISAPLAMTPRIAVGDPPLWEIAVSLVLLAATIPLVINVAGRIYAGAILRTGPRIGLREALRSSRETR
jgi:ABC-2 type transport system permease protein